ncbi:MAG: hypothetical protein KDD33_12825 [Bdellovibrionales bacterium]|nr:hypothetical protein [Bdellovibrionales bacterium]
MKTLIYIIPVLAMVGCASHSKDEQTADKAAHNKPVVTIETSGDLYFEEGGSNIQMDFFGSCAPGKDMIYIEVDNKQAATQCKNGRYRYSMNLPKSFFKKILKDKRSPSSQYALKEIKAYHGNHKKLNATSYILIDRKKKEVKSVINKQVKYERLPTGDYQPVTQYNAFGACSTDASVTIDISAPDRFGHSVSKYDETKPCQASGFYFLTQIDGFAKKGTRFNVFETKTVVPSSRQPASTKKVRPKLKPLFDWSLPIN